MIIQTRARTTYKKRLSLYKYSKSEVEISRLKPFNRLPMSDNCSKSVHSLSFFVTVYYDRTDIYGVVIARIPRLTIAAVMWSSLRRTVALPCVFPVLLSLYLMIWKFNIDSFDKEEKKKLNASQIWTNIYSENSRIGVVWQSVLIFTHEWILLFVCRTSWTTKTKRFLRTRTSTIILW